MLNFIWSIINDNKLISFVAQQRRLAMDISAFCAWSGSTVSSGHFKNEFAVWTFWWSCGISRYCRWCNLLFLMTLQTEEGSNCAEQFW